MAEESLYDKLTDPKIVKMSTIIAFTIALTCLLIGYIIASVYGTTGYNIFDNYISDMGNSEHTPFPYMRTFANVGSGPFFIPLTLYLRKKFTAQIEGQQEKETKLVDLGCIGMLIIFLGMVLTGIITLDVHALAHTILAGIAILGGAITTICYGLVIVKYETEIPKPLGIFMLLIFPILVAGVLIAIPSAIFYEWVLLFSLYIWIALCAAILLKND